MSLTPQDNSRASFAQAQQQQQQQTGGGRQIIFQSQNGVPTPSPSQQQRAYPNPIIRPAHNIHAQQQQQHQQQQHKSPYNTPYAQQNNIGLNISNAVPRQNGPVSAEQQIAQGVLSATPLLVGNGNNNTPQRRPPALGKTIHMPPHGTPQHQSMSVNHAINPISQAQRQAQNGSPAVQNMILGPQQQQQRQAMHNMSANLVPSSVSPVSGSQDMSMIDPQLAVDQQLAQGSVDMMNQQQLPENPEVVQGAMLSAPPGGSFPTFEALFAFAQAHALAHGYAFVIGRSKRDNRGLKKVFLICDRGGTNKEKVAGEQRQRKTKSRKCGCEFGVFGLENKTAWLLRGRIDGEHLTHNHPPSESPTEHPGARKLDPKAIAAVKALEENGVSVKETLEILHRENPSVKYLPRDIYNARAAIKRDPSRVEATAMEELPTFYKKPPLTFEEKLRAELRIEVANAQAETEKVKEQWTKEVAELKEQLRNKDKQIRKFEQFIDICNDRVMARREELDGVE